MFPPALFLLPLLFSPPTHSHPSLFPRQSTAPAPGTPEWLSIYPPSLIPGPQAKPAWLAALQAAIDEGRIPDVPVAQLTEGQAPQYPDGTDLGPEGACAWSSNGCFAGDDLVETPAGVLAISFDDGPTADGRELVKFLAANNQSATHFMIGSNILENPDLFMDAFNAGGNIAVHTWSHSYLTTQTNDEIVGELGWHMQIVSDLTGGRLPAFIRPPFGDTDNRVRAIASEVFGLQTVIWSRDTNDWRLSSGPGGDGSGVTLDSVKTDLSSIFGSSPGARGCMPLEHEVNPSAVQAFIETFPLARPAGWDTRNVPNAFGRRAYVNADGNVGAVEEREVAGPGASGPAESASETSSSTSASTSESPSSSASAAGATSTSSARASTSPSASSVPGSSSSSTAGTSTASAPAQVVADTVGTDTLQVGAASGAERLGWTRGVAACAVGVLVASAVAVV